MVEHRSLWVVLAVCGDGERAEYGGGPGWGINIKPPIPTILREVVVTGSRTGSPLWGAMGSLLGGLGRMSFGFTDWYVPKGATGDVQTLRPYGTLFPLSRGYYKHCVPTGRGVSVTDACTFSARTT